MEAIFLEISTSSIKVDRNAHINLRHAENFTTIENCKVLRKITGEQIPQLKSGDHFYFDDTNEMVEVIKVMSTSNGNIAYVVKNTKIYDNELKHYLDFLQEKFEEEKKELFDRIDLYSREYDKIQHCFLKLRDRKIFGININRKFSNETERLYNKEIR